MAEIGYLPRPKTRQTAMSETNVFYFRADIGGLDLSMFFQHAKVLLEASELALQALATDLGSYSGYLSRSVVRELVSRHFQENDMIGRLIDLLSWTSAYFKFTGKKASELLFEIERWLAANNST